MHHSIEKIYISKPEQIKDALKIIQCQYPEVVKTALHRASLGHHLDEEMMNEALKDTIRFDGTHAPFWTPEEFNELLAKNNTSLLYEKYNEYDLSYLAQFFYADLKSLGNDPMTFVHIAEDMLHDIDNPKTSEVAYWLACYKIGGGLDGAESGAKTT